MKYYIDTIEQTMEKDSEGNITKLNEYGKREVVGRTTNETDEEYLNKTIHKFFEKLDNVSNHIGDTHTYMMIQIINSIGNAVKGDTIGTYLQDIPKQTVEGYFHDNKFYSDYDEETQEYSGEIEGRTDTLYVDTPTGDKYKWNGTAFVGV